MAGDPETIGAVLAATTGVTSGDNGLSEEIARLAEQLRQLQAASLAGRESARASSSEAAGGGFSAGSLLDFFGTGFGTGLGLSPLISGIANLFGGGGENPVPAPLVRFGLPPAVQVNAGVSESGGQAFAVDYSQGGLPRARHIETTPTQITVQVQAIDSRSFLDHSGEIALAVRQAMLESNVLNDVVREV